MVRTVLFDLAEVCLQGILGVEKVIAPVTGVVESEVRPNHLSGPHIYDFFRGRLSEEGYLQRVMELGGYPESVQGEPTLDFLKRAIRANFVPIPGTLDLVGRLAGRGLQIGLLSDHGREWISYIEEQHTLDRVFEKRVYSFETGFVKEEVESFGVALRRLRADPEETLFIDDRAINLEVARRAGIRHTYQFTDAKSLEAELSKRGLL
ncbi:MAG: HAD family phosphatase [Nanoarchaeota archaeon]